MLARVATAALIGIDAVPVVVEVDVSSGGLPGLTIVGSARCDGTGKPRARAIGDPQRGLPVSHDARHGQPGAGGSAQGRRGVRPADRAGRAGGLRRASLPRWPRLLIVGGRLAGRQRAGDAGPARRSRRPRAGRAPACSSRTATSPRPRSSRASRCFPVRSLAEAARVFVSPSPRPRRRDRRPRSQSLRTFATISADVRGQLLGRRAIEIAAAGAHHLLFSGPPGAGKTMLARRLPGLLPPLHVRRGADGHDHSLRGRHAAGGRRA